MIVRSMIRKVPQVGVVLLGVTALTFALLNLLPGNVAAMILGDRATPESMAQVTRELGLDEPLWVRYISWLTAALHGDFGSSVFTSQPVWGTLWERVPATMELVVLAFTIAITGSVMASVAAARRPGGLVDRAVTVVTSAALAMPDYLVGLLGILVFSVTIPFLPASGWVPFSENPVGNLQHAILPALALAAAPFAIYTRLLRGDMVEQLLRQEYVVMARAKGLSTWRILVLHVLRNAMFPMLTMVALTTSVLVGGAVVVETLFGVPGVGQLLVQSINTRDAPVVLGVVVFVAMAVVIANLVVDFLYTVLDPRVRHERSDG